MIDRFGLRYSFSLHLEFKGEGEREGEGEEEAVHVPASPCPTPPYHKHYAASSTDGLLARVSDNSSSNVASAAYADAN